MYTTVMVAGSFARFGNLHPENRYVKRSFLDWGMNAIWKQGWFPHQERGSQMKQTTTPEPIVILDCRWKESRYYNCQKYAVYGLTYANCPVVFYCGEHLIEEVMEGINEGFKPFITIPLYRHAGVSN